jgi:xanthosine utilization system XapX-like protein
MKRMFEIALLTAGAWTLGVGVSYALSKSPAPAPEIGASSIGLLMAAGIAYFARRQRR